MRQLKICCLLILVISTLLSCSRYEDGNCDIILDIYPVDISFCIKNVMGYDLLNSATDGNITQNEIKVIYDGKEYPRDKDMSQTRASLAVFRGLYTSKYGNDNILTFGEFDGAKDHNKSFTIDWGDGTKDEILFTHIFELRHNNPKSYTEVYLNRKKVEGVFTIIK